MEISKKIGRRLLCFLVSLLCLLLLVQPTAAEANGNTSAIGVCTAKVYYGPSEQSRVIGQLLHGTALQVLGQSGSFWKVDCYGMNGYIAKRNLVCAPRNEYYVNCPLYTEQSELFFRYRADEARSLQDSVVKFS